MASVLLVIDVQNDFIDGALGSEEAVSVLPNIIQKIREFDGEIIFTRDTHSDQYLSTQEGKKLPVLHCIENSKGWELPFDVEKLRIEKGSVTFDKPVFGSLECTDYLKEKYDRGEIDSITLIGYCTDICVISNALMIKSMITEIPVVVDSSCCAGVTREKHEAALEVMKSCLISVI